MGSLKNSTKNHASESTKADGNMSMAVVRARDSFAFYLRCDNIRSDE